nr:uncharacterized protein LOC126526259 [Dermacentor andersoni]
MAASAWRGYDPETMAQSEIVAEGPSSLETSTPTEEIVDEGLFPLVALRKRQQRSNTSAVNGRSMSSGTSVPTNPEKSNPQLSQAAGSKKWWPTAMPRLRKEGFTIVIKPRVTISLKTALQNVPSGSDTTSKAPTTSNKRTKDTTGPAPPAGTLPGRAPKSPRSTNPKASRDTGAPTFQDGDFPALEGPPSGTPKNTSQPKVGSRDGPPPPPRTPLPSPPPKIPPHPPLNSDVMDHRRELETLRA